MKRFALFVVLLLSVLAGTAAAQCGPGGCNVSRGGFGFGWSGGGGCGSGSCATYRGFGRRTVFRGGYRSYGGRAYGGRVYGGFSRGGCSSGSCCR